MLNKLFNRSLLLTACCVGLFVITLITLALLRAGWDEPPPADKTQVKITLPVIDWGKYLELSKHP